MKSRGTWTPEQIDGLFEGLGSKTARVKYGAANAIAAAASIALAKPHLADRIVKEILKVERATYTTPECRNVAIGHAIRSFDRFLGHVKNRRAVLAFVTRQLDNPRPATSKKAGTFLKRWATSARW
jgi:hypothetical protein